MTKKLYIVRGLPGSGKSTFAEAIVGSDFLVCTAVCEADQYFMQDGEYMFDGSKLKDAHEYCRNKVETYMKDSLVNDQFYREIAVSNTFTQEWEMQPYLDLAKQYGYMVFTIIVENRHGGVNTHGCPDEALVRMRDRFEIKL